MSDDIAERVATIVTNQLDVDKEKVKPEASFINDLGADSLDLAKLIVEFGKTFSANICDDDIRKIRTVGDATDYIESKVGTETLTKAKAKEVK